MEPSGGEDSMSGATCWILNIRLALVCLISQSLSDTVYCSPCSCCLGFKCGVAFRFSSRRFTVLRRVQTSLHSVVSHFNVSFSFPTARISSSPSRGATVQKSCEIVALSWSHRAETSTNRLDQDQSLSFSRWKISASPGSVKNGEISSPPPWFEVIHN